MDISELLGQLNNMLRGSITYDGLVSSPGQSSNDSIYMPKPGSSHPPCVASWAFFVGAPSLLFKLVIEIHQVETEVIVSLTEIEGK